MSHHRAITGNMKRTTLKIAGASGMGLLSIGEILSRSLKHLGFYIHSDREYPSLIKGGHSNVQLDFGMEELNCLSETIDFVMALDHAGLIEYVKTVKRGGIVVHGCVRTEMIRGFKDIVEERKVKLIYLPAREMALSLGGTELMANMVLLGLMWRVLGLPLKPLREEVKKRFAKKAKLLKIDLKCLDAGYKAKGLDIPKTDIPLPKTKPKKIILNGNMAIALGAIQCGVRAYFAYPMSPASSILTYVAEFCHDSDMLVKQAEDEITAAQMTLGSMTMGTRALVATSGGGYDLMTETVSLAGMIESPWVCVICQRPGPATGLPTWTGQGDLKLAIYSSHGEFPRVVVAVSDPASCYELIQHAMNLAEEFQVPVIVLSEKVICESQTMVDPFQHKAIPIRRGLVTDKKQLEKLEQSDRYKVSASGLSRRWIPGSSKTFYYANGDEHWEGGQLTEEGEPVKEMIAKRLRKMQTIKKNLPEPEVIGPKSKADISFVGWGSSKGVMKDVIRAMKRQGVTVNYLHFDYLLPLKTKRLKKFFEENKKVCLIEGNHNGQLGNLIRLKSGLEFKKRLLKWNGRPFFLEEVIDFINHNL